MAYLMLRKRTPYILYNHTQSSRNLQELNLNLNLKPQTPERRPNPKTPAPIITTIPFYSPFSSSLIPSPDSIWGPECESQHQS